METHTDVKLDVVWKPYQIDPGTDVDGESFHSYCQRRWGGSGWTKHLRIEGSKDGCMFSNWKYWPNTLRAHQWIQYGMEHNLSDSDTLNEALFYALYENGQNISTVETLVALALDLFPKDNKFDPKDLRDFLENNRGVVSVQKEMSQLRRQYKIRGVPFFQFEASDDASGEFRSSYSLSGAQQCSVFSDVLEELVRE